MSVNDAHTIILDTFVSFTSFEATRESKTSVACTGVNSAIKLITGREFPSACRLMSVSTIS